MIVTFHDRELLRNLRRKVRLWQKRNYAVSFIRDHITERKHVIMSQILRDDVLRHPITKTCLGRQKERKKVKLTLLSENVYQY